jgi:hypothetical protein
MQPIYKKHPLTDDEILHLIAFLEQAKEGREEATSARFNFFLLGLAGTGGAFALFDYLWRRRFRGVRRSLVASYQLPVGSYQLPVGSYQLPVGSVTGSPDPTASRRLGTGNGQPPTVN